MAVIAKIWRRVRENPPAFVFVALLAALAAQPFLTGQFPSSADGRLHVYRLIEFDHAVRHGMLYPRWSPDLVYGYGFPLFHYYAPLPYYVGAIFHGFGLSYQLALQATFILLLVVAGWAVYRLLDEAFSPAAGVVGALAYLYAPYMGFTSGYRGALGESAGLALMPLALWMFFRLAERPTRGRFALAALSFAALVLAHNLTALLFAPVLAAALLALWLAGDRTPRKAALLAGAVIAGLLLSAFFWLPAFAERDLVQIDRVFGPAAFDFRLHFLSLADLFSLPAPADPNQILPPVTPGLGLTQVGLALVAMWRLLRGEMLASRRGLVAGALGGAVALLLLTLPLSLPIWENLSLLRFVQFSWRLLGPASLLLAIVVGAALHNWPRLPDRGRIIITTGVALLIALNGMGWLFGGHEPPLDADSVQDIHRYEVEFNAAGTTAFLDYLPDTVAEVPPADGLAERYAAADVITRLSENTLPGGVSVVEQSAGLNWARATVESDAAFTATWDWFYFPGWRATLDGDPVALTPSKSFGLLQVDVPAGRHTLEIRFGPTPLRTAANLASLGTLLIGAVALWRWADRTQLAPAPRAAFDLRWLWLAGAMLALLALKVGYLNHNDSIFRRSRFDGQSVQGITSQSATRFGGEMLFLGYAAEAESLIAGQTLEISLYWATQQPLTTDYSTGLLLVDGAGNTITQSDSQHPAGVPTSRWLPGEYAADLHHLTIPPGTPPGRYSLLVSAYSPITPLGATNAEGAFEGSQPAILSLTVTRPARPPQLAHIERGIPIQAELTDGLSLVGYTLPEVVFTPGDSLPLQLIWRAGSAPARDWQANLTLHDHAGQIALQQTIALASDSYPPGQWSANEIVRGWQQLKLPANLPGGTYDLSISIEKESVRLGEVEISPLPDPQFAAPQGITPAQANWQDGLSLLGYDLTQVGDLQLTLYWQADNPPDASYTVFVHVLNDAGQLVAQHDSLPAEWTRPTFSWRAGEVISDPHSFDLPAGTYTLRIGWYNANNQLPLPLIGSSHLFITLP